MTTLPHETPDELVEQLCLAYASGKSLATIGAEVGIGPVKVRAILAEAGVTIRCPIPPKEIPPERDILMVVLYQAGFSLEDVGALLTPPMSKQGVHRRMQAIGAARRPWDPTRRRRRRRVFSGQETSRMVEMWLHGASIADICATFHTSWESVTREMREMGILEERRRATAREVVVELARTGTLTAPQIVARTGYSPGTVAQILAEEGRRRRAAGEPPLPRHTIKGDPPDLLLALEVWRLVRQEGVAVAEAGKRLGIPVHQVERAVRYVATLEKGRQEMSRLRDSNPHSLA